MPEFPAAEPSAPLPDLAAAVMGDSESSLFDKLDPATRAKLDRAIIDRAPRAYREVYENFQLKTRAVSYSAFYYYARRLRTSNDLLEHARLATAESPSSEQSLRDVLARRVLEAALDESASPRLIHRLADTWRMIVSTHLVARAADERLEAARRREKGSETRDLCRLVNKFCHHRDLLERSQARREESMDDPA